MNATETAATSTDRGGKPMFLPMKQPGKAAVKILRIYLNTPTLLIRLNLSAIPSSGIFAKYERSIKLYEKSK